MVIFMNDPAQNYVDAKKAVDDTLLYMHKILSSTITPQAKEFLKGQEEKLSNRVETLLKAVKTLRTGTSG